MWVLDDSEVHFPLWTCLVMDWHINSRKSSSPESPSTAASQELHQLSLDAGGSGRMVTYFRSHGNSDIGLFGRHEHQAE